MTNSLKKGPIASSDNNKAGFFLTQRIGIEMGTAIIISIILNIPTHLLFVSTDKPVVAMSLGSTLNPNDIKEGDDVYFECNIRANPKEYRISWYHNVSESKYMFIFFRYYFKFMCISNV